MVAPKRARQANGGAKHRAAAALMKGLNASGYPGESYLTYLIVTVCETVTATRARIESIIRWSPKSTPNQSDSVGLICHTPCLIILSPIRRPADSP